MGEKQNRKKNDQYYSIWRRKIFKNAFFLYFEQSNVREDSGGNGRLETGDHVRHKTPLAAMGLATFHRAPILAQISLYVLSEFWKFLPIIY
jgi:hypothetical protein